ncbi:TadE/TadG family type IV pilus assembly protein [Nocardiopsis sp. RSe5-2]|uniref:TadE/TadG family type IV pilus assembly protein n=1 Tax=Nocardiopsis endophytica TaxID=3018445 RepID=A0ABT4TZ12_9ACTN|nr:TadE/TadG family type IV pilus assembly protein [Nocardiopsis endophytica]MDA2809917.1 TadE/TadG family type IV pilus assembly protein [Nocardiopsis endophytica]
MRTARTRSDRGSAELAVATPLLLLLLLLVIQAGLVAHASQVAQSIATTALAEARAVDATDADGQAAGEHAGEQLGGRLLRGLNVEVHRDDEAARVVVTAQVPSVLPGLTWPIRHESSGPVERFTSPP